MTSRLIVVKGKIKFVFFDSRKKSNTHGLFKEIIISESDNLLIIAGPKLWYGFQSLSTNQSKIINLPNMTHEANETIKKDINEIEYSW